VIVLALETATIEVGAALVSADGLLAESRTPCRRRHAETLHGAVASVLSAAGVGVGDVDAVAVDVGPGLYTGLRVGIAAAKAFGFALGIPLVAVRSTEVLCRGAGGDPAARDRAVVAVVDVRRGELAWEFPDGSLSIGAPAVLRARLADLGGRVLLVGDGAAQVAASPGEPQRGVALSYGGDALAAPSVATLGAIGVERLAAGATTDAVAITPCYLRAADARANWATRNSPATEGRD
jgi:tRNA threonylcarbamoyladenosine biosynthesis protein TsaB